MTREQQIKALEELASKALLVIKELQEENKKKKLSLKLSNKKLRMRKIGSSVRDMTTKRLEENNRKLEKEIYKSKEKALKYYTLFQSARQLHIDEQNGK